MADAQISSHEIDLINGHLTATSKDALEIEKLGQKRCKEKELNFPTSTL